MSMALFELEAPAWVPVVQSCPWADPERETTRAGWNAWVRSWRCRDCGRLIAKAPHTHFCGPGSGGWLCDDCATIDGCQARHDCLHDCEGWPDRHVSTWGLPHTAEEHGRLADEREKHRAAYRREVGL